MAQASVGIAPTRYYQATHSRTSGLSGRSSRTTAILLGLLTSMILAVGYWLGGSGGLMIAVIVSLAMNAATYFWSDKR